MLKITFTQDGTTESDIQVQIRRTGIGTRGYVAIISLYPRNLISRTVISSLGKERGIPILQVLSSRFSFSRINVKYRAMKTKQHAT